MGGIYRSYSQAVTENEVAQGVTGVSLWHSSLYIGGAVRKHMKKRMSRREVREQIFKLLFQLDFCSKEELEENWTQLEGQLLASMEELDAEQEKKTELLQKVHDISSKLESIDSAIDSRTTGWKTTRMAKVDLTLIRLAVYEIQYEEDVPTKVAINEAVELAKIYGSESSPSFVNGVLAKLA